MSYGIKIYPNRVRFARILLVIFCLIQSVFARRPFEGTRADDVGTRRNCGTISEKRSRRF